MIRSKTHSKSCRGFTLYYRTFMKMCKRVCKLSIFCGRQPLENLLSPLLNTYSQMMFYVCSQVVFYMFKYPG